MIRSLFFLCTISLLCTKVSSQNDTTKATGTILSGQVVIQKDKKVLLPSAEKIYSSGKEPVVLSNSLDLKFKDFKSKIPFPSERTLITPSVPVEPQFSGYHNFIKAGYGNYRSPLIHAGWYDELHSWSLGSEVYYESFASGPVRQENSGSEVFSIDLRGAHQSGSWKLLPYLSYDYLGYRFYGNTGTQDGIFSAVAPKGSSGIFEAGAHLYSNSGRWKYQLNPHFSTTSSRFDKAETLNQETLFGLSAGASLSIGNGQTAGMSLYAQGGNYDGGLSYGRSALGFKPWFSWKLNKLSLRTGLAVFTSKSGAVSTTKIYPDVRLSYPLQEGWFVYGALYGNQELLRLDSILQQNQFLDDSLNLAIIEDRIGFQFGIEGSLASNLAVEAQINYRSRNGMPFFTGSNTDTTRFSLSYDQSAIDIFSMKGKINYEPTSSFRTGLSIELFSFGLSTLEKPWHQPSWILRPFVSQAIHRKLLISASGAIMGGISAPESAGSVARLAAFADLSASAKFLFTDRISSFIEANNLLNYNFERYLGYPSRGFTFKIGGQYRF